MKIVVQNGSRHCLSRKDVEAILSCIPESWKSKVNQVLLVKGDALRTSFHAKERALVLHCPWEPKDQRAKAAATEILLRGLAELSRDELRYDFVTECQECVATRISATKDLKKNR